MTLKTLVDGLTFPEGPRWHEGRLWFSDFYSHRVLAVDPAGTLETITRVEQQPSGLGFLPGGGMLIVSMLDRKLLKLDPSGNKAEVADLSHIATGPCNDMCVDAKGRAYVGNFGYDRHKGEPLRATAIARVDPDGRVTKAADELLFPNGTVITPDGRTLIVGETQGHRLTAFDIAANGSLSNRRVWAQLDDACFPDGMCLDADGCIWVADARGHGCIRVKEGGAIVERISTGERHAFACMLGGADRRTLFLCTSTASGPQMAEKTDGRIETVEVKVPGAGLP